MRILKSVSFLVTCFILFSCNEQTPPQPSDPPQTKTNGQLISIEKAKTMIEYYYNISRSADTNEEPTVSVHYTKEDFEMLFNQNAFFSWQAFKDVKYDGVRIYYGRYDKTTAARGEDIGKNTLVLILTQKNKDGVYEDIIPGVKEVPVLPLNDGSRCKPNCNGNILFNPGTK